MLRPMTMDYLDEYVALRSQSEIARYLRSRDQAALRERLGADQDRWNRDGYGPFAALDRYDGTFRGRVNLRRRADTNEIEIGWMFKRESWGQGFATEAAQAVITWCFQVLKIPYVTAFMKPANERSHRVAKRLGMTLLRTGSSDSGIEQVFAISRDAWQAGHPAQPRH